MLHSRGALAGAGSAISLVAAALASLIFAAGLVGFTGWPAGSSPSLPSVVVPGAATPAPSGAAGRATAVTLPVRAVARLRATGRRAAVRTIVRPALTDGRVPASRTGSAPATGAPVASAPVAPPAPAPLMQRVASTLAGDTTTVTGQAGAAVGGPVGAAVASTGATVAQTLDSLGSVTQSVLGG